MYSISFLMLIAAANYPDGSQAAVGRLSRRQSAAPVELWGACNFPSQGINGPLPCASGSECICKDNTYAQCRQQIDGSWTPDPSWQCQQPGTSPTGTLSSSDPSTDNTGSGGNTGGTSTNQDNAAPNTNSDGSSTNSDGSSSNPGGSNSNPGGSNSNPGGSNSNSGGSNTNSGGSNTNSGGSNTNSGGSNTNSDGSNTNSGGSNSNPGGSSNPSPGSGPSQAATIGDCSTASAPGGWDGVASTSYYGWQGSACDCGQNSWQWTSGSGVYNGAVNQKLFQGSLNSAGQPNCGSACGGCYELSTSGFNTYNGGVPSGSTITLQIVDACYGAGGNWCGSTSDDYKDSSSCSVHFDIQTGPPGSDGQSAVGADGQTWNGGGQIVYYRKTSCPQTLSSGYHSSCTC